MVLRQVMGDDKKEKYSSIFDAVSKIERKKALEKVLSTDANVSGVNAEKLPLLTNEEIAQKLDQYHKLHNLLADSLDQAYVKNNLSPSKLREYFSTPKNFSDEQWRLIQNEKANIDQMIMRLLPNPTTKSEGASPGSEEKRPKKMQVKSRWLPMH